MSTSLFVGAQRHLGRRTVGGDAGRRRAGEGGLG